MKQIKISPGTFLIRIKIASICKMIGFCPMIPAFLIDVLNFTPIQGDSGVSYMTNPKSLYLNCYSVLILQNYILNLPSNHKNCPFRSMFFIQEVCKLQLEHLRLPWNQQLRIGNFLIC